MSYLHPLRLHFAGRFQAAPSTVNNDFTHYDNANFKPEYQQRGTNAQPNGWWNPRGDADWRLIGCRVTAAWHADGKAVGNDDLVLTCLIADSDRQAAAKLVDLDPQQQLVSAIWGLEVRICDAKGKTLLRGQYETASFVDLWQRATGSGGNTGDFMLGAMYQSILSKLEWGNSDGSPFLKELRDAAQDGLLSIKFNVDGYTMNPNSPEFTRGRIVGTIGPAAAEEPRYFVRGRQFMAAAESKINFCTAVVDQQAGKILLDLGNALPTTQPGGPLEDLGALSMAYTVQPAGSQSVPLGSIAYTEKGWYERTAGIVELPADRRLSNEELNAISTNPLTLLLPGPDKHPVSAIAEAPDGLYVRADQFVFRLNPGDQVEVGLFATRFGQPYAGAHILLNSDPGQLQGGPGQTAVPASAVEYPSEAVAGEDGGVTIAIHGHDPGNPRGYIDGQTYGVRPTLKEVAAAGSNHPSNPWNFISLLLFGDFHGDDPPTWWGSIQPIFQQYANLYPVMGRFLNLADYASVCDKRDLLLLAFGHEAKHPNAMPVTRDLSAAKRKAILRWLEETDQDGKPRLGTPPPAHVAPLTRAAVSASPPIQAGSLDYLKGGKTAAMSRRLALRSPADQSQPFTHDSGRHITLKPELFAALDTHDGLLRALQQAVELEHATIPAYLYALYSIKPNSNTEIQKLILSVVIEEMLHMALACNILNAIGGSPVIDDPKFIPQYPGPLPGAVASGLIVPLKPFSLDLVKNVFMVIEQPEAPLHFPVRDLAAVPPHTIGQFYGAIRRQIKECGSSIFVGDPAKQVTSGFWPDELIKVTDVDSATRAIEIIVEQGEGTSRSPQDQDYDYAHYYRFAEIYHGKKLIINHDAPAGAPDDQKYVYGGDPILFDANGVLPVIENPTASAYPAGSKARYACDTFNYTYTSLLKTLHVTFNGSPDQLSDAIGLMESLKEQAMNLMDIDLGNGTKAGPSFAYQPINP